MQQLLEIYSTYIFIFAQKDIYSKTVTAILFEVAKDKKTPKRLIKKETDEMS
jgi:hypothetical protein